MIMANDAEKGRIAVASSVGAVSAASVSPPTDPTTVPTTSSASAAEDNEKEAARLLQIHTPIKTSKGKLTPWLAFSVFSVTLASFQFGYHIGCVNAPGGLVTEWIMESHQNLFNSTLTPEQADLSWSVAVSVFAFGGMIGGLMSGWLADKVGRRGALLYNNIIAFAAAAFMGLSKSVGVYFMIIIGRVLIGFNCGLSSGLVPMYLTEVSPVNLRGMLGSLHQLLVTIAILVSQILGLPALLGTEDRWPVIFAFTIVPAVLQVGTLIFCPESPKYSLAVRGDTARATNDLKKLRGTDNVSLELNEMEDEVRAAAALQKPSMASMFKGSLRWPMTIAIMMMLSQQLSGINVAMFYSTVIFKNAGLSSREAVWATIGMGSVNVIMTIISVWLVDHPKFGRRILHLVGLVGMWITTILIALSLLGSGDPDDAMIPFTKLNYYCQFGAIIFVLLFVIAFATGPGAIPWFFVSEIFASSARGNANSIAVMVNWTANLLVGLTFLPINNVLGPYSFFIFTGFLTFFIFFTFKYVPETKGKTVEEITATFEKSR